MTKVVVAKSAIQWRRRRNVGVAWFNLSDLWVKISKYWNCQDH